MVFSNLSEYYQSIGGELIRVCTFGTETAKSTIITASRGLKINNDVALYLSSLIPVERGIVWSIEDCYYGNEESGRGYVGEFRKTVDEYDGLLEVALGIQGLVNKRGTHPCFDEDTLITTYEGLKKIKDIKIGDRVLTHNNRFKTVVKVMENETDEIYDLKTRSAFPVEVTSGHPFYVRERTDIKRKKTFSDPKWKSTEELNEGKDYIGVAINTESIVPNYEYFDLPFDDAKFWWVVGRYMGDGWTEYHRRGNKGGKNGWEEKRAIICCTKKGRDELNEICNILKLLNFEFRYEEGRATYKIFIKNNCFYEYIQKYGKYSSGKYLHGDVFNLPSNLLRSFLDGYMGADGSYNETRDKYSFKTVSKELAIGLIQVVNKVYKRHVGVTMSSAKQETIEGRAVSSKEKYEIYFSTNTKLKDQSFYEDGYIWTPISKLTSRKIKKRVYNLSVVDDNSYVANGMIAHNCGVLITNDSFTNRNALMRAPSGELISQFDLDDSEYVGNIKYDFLNTKTCGMIQVALEMLIEHGFVEWQGSLKETYEKTLHPDVLDKTTPELWKRLGEYDLISAFQFDSPVGEQALKSIKPTSLIEAANANNLMRLMSDDGEQPLEMYVRYKEDISQWHNDMKRSKLTEEEIKIMERHLLKDMGVCSSQEGMMVISMDKDIAEFDVVEANALRKGVAKKKGDVYENAHKLFFEKGREKGTSENLLKYVWDVQIAMQKGYGFSILHGIEYTYILIQQLNLIHYYPQIFWNTAVLMVESGALEQDTGEESEDEDTTFKRKEKTTNYGAIAKAIGHLQHKGVAIVLPDINKADLKFKPDVENDEIIFGLKGIMRINNDVARLIMENRPFEGLDDFYKRMVLTKHKVTLSTGAIQNRSLVPTSLAMMLIKAGAFDKVEDKPREEVLEDFLRMENPPKKSMTAREIEKVVEMGIVPSKFKTEIRLYKYKKYIQNNKRVQDEDQKTIQWHSLNDGNERTYEHALQFFEEYFIGEMEENKDYKYDENGVVWVAMGTQRKGSFNAVYDKNMELFMVWLKGDECLNYYNERVFQDIKSSHMKGNISTWEMESMNFYYHEHELSNVDEKYGVDDFNDLPEEPVVVGFNEYKGRSYPKFQLNRIIGTVLDRDKNRHSITLLTPTAVVLVKFYSGQFAFYDKQMSIIDVDKKGNQKKTILEEGWFKRGNKLLITGFRRGDQFKPKRYKNSIFPHTVQLITDVNEDGTLILQSERINE